MPKNHVFAYRETHTANGAPIEVRKFEQEWAVTLQNNRRVYLQFGGIRRSNGAANNFAKKHLTYGATKHTAAEKRLSVTLKRRHTHIHAYNQARHTKVSQLNTSRGVSDKPMGFNGAPMNTMIDIKKIGLTAFKTAFANAVLPLNDNDDTTVRVGFGTACVYTTRPNGSEWTNTGVEVSVRRYGDTYEIYHLDRGVNVP